jgi:hypothetical protein
MDALSTIAQDKLQLEIIKAEQEAADAKKEAARFSEVAERERLARVELEEKLRPRRLSPKERDTIRSALAKFQGTLVAIWIYGGDAEAAQYAQDLRDAVIAAGWFAGGIGARNQPPPYPTGLLLISPSLENPPAAAFQQILRTLGITTSGQIGPVSDLPGTPRPAMDLFVGLKP